MLISFFKPFCFNYISYSISTLTQNVSLLLLYTDVDNGLAISTDVLSPFEKTNVTLTCGASVYAFSRIHWYYTDNHNVTTPIKRKSRGYSLESNLTSFSKVSVLTLIDVDVNRTGMYSCSATRRVDGKISSAEIPISVRSMYD